VKCFVLLQLLNLRESAELLGRGISPSQGRYLTKAQSGNQTHDPTVRADEGSSYFLVSDVAPTVTSFIIGHFIIALTF
jgi:hypothetical protein